VDAVFIRDAWFRITNRQKDASLRFIIMQKVSVLLRNRMSHSEKHHKWRDEIAAALLEKMSFPIF